MLIMENSEEILQILERYTKLKPKDIPKELEDYLCYVAKTGDTVYRWSHVKYLFQEKLVLVIKEFHDTTPSIDDLPQYPNVDPFNYETMKSALIERLELFSAAPFTIQRLCELLTDPRKQYSRIDKYMRALEKNILVVSTVEPGRKQAGSENGDSLDSVVNGDLSLDVNVEIDMESESIFHIETPNIITAASSSLKTESLDDQMPETKKTKLEVEEKIEDEEESKEENIKQSDRATTEEDEEAKPPISEESAPIETDVDHAVAAQDSEIIDAVDHKENKEESTEELKSPIPNIQEDSTTKESEEEIDPEFTVVTHTDKVISQENKDIAEEETDKENKENENILTTELDVVTEKVAEIEPTSTTSSLMATDEQIPKEVQASEVKSESEVAITNVPIDSKIDSNESSEEDKVAEKIDIAEIVTAETTIAENIPKVPEQMSVEETAALLPETEDCPTASPPVLPSISSDPQIIPDQPMDENLETVVSSTSQLDTTCQNEIMQTETEMATDSDTTKADPAVMDVDDTSQEEAMDQ